MPGTWGSLLVGVPLWWLLSHLGPWGYGLAWLVLLAAAIWAAGRAGPWLGAADHPAIVIDEVAGLLAALAGVPRQWPWVACGFLVFRALDILKPFPLRHLERLPGGFGVVLDDVAAGIAARLLLALALALGG
jgi:phosphatidylglycerophosphatase A